MRKTVLFSVLCAIAVIIAIIAMYNINPDDRKMPDIPDNASAATMPKPISKSIYEIRLSGETLYMTVLDETGAELDREALEYIDIYSLPSSQLETVRSGAKFDSREAAAEFIQDLDS